MADGVDVEAQVRVAERASVLKLPVRSGPAIPLGGHAIQSHMFVSSLI